MRKVIAAINMTLDGFCDHDVIVPDQEIHQHYADLLRDSGVALYGRVTFQLMEYWKGVLDNPTGNKATDDFAVTIDQIPKIVFSQTLSDTDWQSAELAAGTITEEIHKLRKESGKDILVCSPGLIVQMTQLRLIDEYQLCIHPVIVGSGRPLFRDIHSRVALKLSSTKRFGSGAVAHYYSAPVSYTDHSE